MFDQHLVQKKMEKCSPSPISQLFSLEYLKTGIIGQTWYYLLIFCFLYYIVQIGYQLDLLCTTLEKNQTTSSKPPTTTTATLEHEHDVCVKRTKDYFKNWAAHFSTMTRLLTFLLGFYVSTICKRWWDQVSKLPDADNLGLVLGGLVWAQSEAEADAARDFKKTILRYTHLSWTMCLARISTPLSNKFSSAQEYIDKKLLTKSEAEALKIDTDDRDCSTLWWVPLSWAVSMVNDAFNNKEKGKDGLIPKDHKDVVSAICKVRNDLFNLAEYRLQPLPAIYTQAVWVAVYGWALISIVANQSRMHYRDNEASLVVTILLSFPGHELLMFLLIFGWLKVADILVDPFGNDFWDIDLVSTLDINIWKSSVTIENQEKATHPQLLKRPYLQ
eukprot:GFUD01012859.1.p1 GENE.GFUD01012859.1~~GFUD01012859.1.p1  ORF type:complete len:435 (-),score=93.53 GFUD01012859.1:908-2068(-)